MVAERRGFYPAVSYWDCRRDGNSLIGGKGGKPPGRLMGALGPGASVSVRIGRVGITLGFSGAGPPVEGMLTPIPPDSPELGFT